MKSDKKFYIYSMDYIMRNIVIIALFGLLTFFSCEKSEPEQVPAVQHGRVASVVAPDHHYVYDYDESGRLVSISFNEGLSGWYEFDYSEEGILVVTEGGYTNTYTYGLAGELENVDIKFKGNDVVTLYFEHSDGLPVKCTADEVLLDEYVWKEGNMTRSIYKSSSQREYSYTDILNNWTIPMPFFSNFSPTSERFIYPIMCSRNLPSQIDSKSFIYERDSHGNISKVTVQAGSSSREYKIEYENL